MRKIDEAIMELSIVSNPHVEDKAEREKLANELLSRRRFMRAEDGPSEKLDVRAFETWRSHVKKGSRTMGAK